MNRRTARSGSFHHRSAREPITFIPSTSHGFPPPLPGRALGPSLTHRAYVRGTRAETALPETWSSGRALPDRVDTGGRRPTRLLQTKEMAMQKLSLDALARQELKRAAKTDSGRSAETIVGGHATVLRQPVIAM